MKKVLVLIDDNPMLVYFLAKDLSEFYEVKGFSKPEDAIQYMQENKDNLDVVISDYKMPNYNGLEVLSAAKDVVPTAVRVLLTGYMDSLEPSLDNIFHLVLDKNLIKDAKELIKQIEQK